MTTDSPTLAPCPFCGGNDTYRTEDARDHGFIACSDCHARGPSVDLVGPLGWRASHEAWNRRPDRSPAGELLTVAEIEDMFGGKMSLDAARLYQDNPDGLNPAQMRTQMLLLAQLYNARRNAKDPFAALSSAPAPKREGPQWDGRAYRLGYASGRSSRTPEVDALVEALRPFAQLADYYTGPDDTDADGICPMIGDYRHARAALAAYEEKKDG